MSLRIMSELRMLTFESDKLEEADVVLNHIQFAKLACCKIIIED